MSDVLDMFAPPPTAFRASLWLYGSTKGVVALGGVFPTEEGAQTALRSYTEIPDLAFSQLVNTGQSHANVAWKNQWNRAVVTRADGGDVTSDAPLPDDWFPPGDPRRVS